MSHDSSEPCSRCFALFPRYNVICPACREARWDRWYEFIPPDKGSWKFRDENRMRVRSEGLTVIPADTLAPKARAAWRPTGAGLVVRCNSINR
jgi:hypothetical protein